MSVFWNGRALVSPAVESAVFDDGLASAFPGRTGNVPVMVGSSLGGKPLEVLLFDSPAAARRTLIGGDLLRAVEAAFAPSAETGSPARVGALRVEQALRSSLTLKDAAAANSIVLTSVQYGALANGIRVTVESGSVSGKRMTVQDATQYFSKDNIARVPMTVRYSGVEATATVEVTATTMVLKAPTATTLATLTLANYRSVRELADAVNAVAGFSAVALIPGSPVVATLDGMAATSAKSVDLAIRADLQAVVDWVNTVPRELVSAARVSGATKPPANLALTYFAGGSNGSAPSNGDWQNAFDVLQGADVRYVVPLTGTAAIHDMADAHAVFMSGPGKSERKCFVGGELVTGSLSTAIAAVIAAAALLGSDRTVQCFPNVLDYDESGALVPFPPYFLAARIAGGYAAMNPAHSMTNKVLNVPGIDPEITSVQDTDALILGGVHTAKRGKRGVVTAKSVTTWLADDNYNRVECSVGIGYDYVSMRLRDAMDAFVGRKGSPLTLYEALSEADSVLRDLSTPEPGGLGVLVGDATSPPYRNLTAEVTGDVLRVLVECSVAIPQNFVLIGISAQAYSGSASLSAI